MDQAVVNGNSLINILQAEIVSLPDIGYAVYGNQSLFTPLWSWNDVPCEYSLFDIDDIHIDSYNDQY